MNGEPIKISEILSAVSALINLEILPDLPGVYEARYMTGYMTGTWLVIIKQPRGDYRYSRPIGWVRLHGSALAVSGISTEILNGTELLGVLDLADPKNTQEKIEEFIRHTVLRTIVLAEVHK